MGFLSFLKKKNSIENTEFEQITVEEALKQYGIKDEELSSKDILGQAEDACKQVLEINQQIIESKNEYDVVTSHLSDIQRIEMIPLEEREGINDAARKIINLSKERLKYKNNKHGITEEQYHYLEQFEQELPRELEQMKAKEKHQNIIKNDLRQLEGEKGICNYQKESAIEKINFIKRLSVVISVLSFVAFAILILLGDSLEKDMTVPFFITGIMAVFAIFYIVVESRRSVYRLRMAEKKLNKVVALTNKVKIKYVNSTNVLEYYYEKYRVHSYQELQFLWTEFVRAKDEIEMYKKNTDLLGSYNEALLWELQNKGIADSNVWLYQPEALVDKKEMVEVRHRLNNRRQKLREQIEFNNKQLDICKNSLLSLKKNYHEYQAAIDDLMHMYHIVC